MQRPRYYCLLSLLLPLFCLNLYIGPLINGQNNATAVEVDIGVILNLDTQAGKASHTCISMAITDFYSTHHNYSTRIFPYFRNANSDVVDAASAAIDLLKNVQVQAILGPQRSTQADFVIDIATKAGVPIVSTATCPAVSPKESPYFVRAAQCSSSQAKAIAAIVEAFNWREVVLVYEDSNYGSGIVPYLSDALIEVNTRVPYRSVISPSASDDQILLELYKLKTMPTRVFVVNMLYLASPFFRKAKEAGMMTKGYAWIITDGITSLLHTMDATFIDSAQGVLGVKPHIPNSNELANFTVRWKKRFRQENPDMERIELDVFGIWAYDSVKALAMAVEKTGSEYDPRFKKQPATGENRTDLESIGISESGPKLSRAIRNIRFRGLSGDFNIVNGQLQPSAYQIVNVIGQGGREIGFWTEKYGISNQQKPSDRNVSTANTDDLKAIVWPGETNVVPKGWEVPTSGNKLRVGVPVKGGFVEFINVEKDPHTNAINPSGFCVDVFKQVMRSLPYAAPYEFVPFETPDGESGGSYDELVYQIFLGNFHAVVGDVTIVANRSKYVDFTLPFTESGVSMIVPIRDDERKNAWIFTKPLSMDLWLTTGAFFVFTGIVVWILEHRVNKEFRGPPRKQVGMIFYFSFSTLVFAHKEKVTSNLSRFVVIVWVFLVLVLTSSYTASLTSMLTVQKLQPTYTDINDLIRKGEYVGYQDGSFVAGLLESKKFDKSKFKSYSTFEEYDEALSRGSRNGGVAAIVDELPYIGLFLAKYCTKYTMVGPINKTPGFGFAFPKGSPLVPDVSRAILNVTEGDIMAKITREWLGDEANCPEVDGAVLTSNSLTLESFKGLFLIAFISSTSALAIYLFIFLNENRNILGSDDSIWQKLVAMAKNFDEEKEKSTNESKKMTEANEEDTIANVVAGDNIVPSSYWGSPNLHTDQGNFSQDEGLSTTEPGTPIHDTRDITETNEERQ